MQSRPALLQRRLTEDAKIIQGYSTGARSESGFVHRHHGHSTTGTFSRYGSDREIYGMAAGTPGGRSMSLNRSKSQAMLADGVGPEQLTEEQRVAMDTTGLTVVRQGMRVVGVPVGTLQFQRDFLQESRSTIGGGGRGCNKFVPVLSGDGTKIVPPGDLFDQAPGEMS